MDTTQPTNESVQQETPSSGTASTVPTSIPIDITVFQTLETRANELSQQLAETVQQLGAHMNNMSTGTIKAGQVYHSAVEELTTDLTTSTQNTVQLITQCDELDKDLGQVQLLSKQIKNVDKGLARLIQSLS